MKRAKQVMFGLPKNQTYIDGYINDILTIILDYEHLILRGFRKVPLICYIFFRPVHKDEPIERSDIISTTKLIAEGDLSETKTFLGWTINTRNLRIYLPKIKLLKWINEIDEMMKLERVRAKSIEKLQGKLNHVAFIIPLSWYFLNRLRYSQTLAEKFRPQKISPSTKDDL